MNFLNKPFSSKILGIKFSQSTVVEGDKDFLIYDMRRLLV